MNNEREKIFEVVKGQYPECRIVDVDRAIILIPPPDGRYGLLPLEVPLPTPTLPEHDERAFSRNILSQMSSFTRALPDTEWQVLDMLGFRELAKGTVWEKEQIDVFLRFGITTKKYRSKREVLKIVPSQYAADMQVILRTRLNEGVETLAELMQQIPGYSTHGWTCSNLRANGCSYVFGLVRVARGLAGILNGVEFYSQLVNGPCLGWQENKSENRKYTNIWLAGVDFR